MKLTGWFTQDKIADNNRIQIPDSENAEQANRQIRSLVPGQTLRGEIRCEGGCGHPSGAWAEYHLSGKKQWADAELKPAVYEYGNRRNSTEGFGYGIASNK